MAEGHTCTAAIDAARRCLPVRSRQLPDQQDYVPARCHARRGESSAEQYHQDLLGCGSGSDAADSRRLDLRNEFQAHAGAGLDRWLSARAVADAGGCRTAVSVFQVAQMAMRCAARAFTLFSLNLSRRSHTCWPPLM